MSEGNCRCRDCERLRSSREHCREKCYCRDCDRERCREKPCKHEREPCREKPKETGCSNVIIQKYAPDCEKSSCGCGNACSEGRLSKAWNPSEYEDSIKPIKIHNDHIIYITIR